METIDVPLSEIKGSRLYKRLEAEGRLEPLTADEMRDCGYTINPYTWPAMGNGHPLMFDRKRKREERSQARKRKQK